MTLRGVLFDWRGTLFHDLDDEEWVRLSAASIGRDLPNEEVRRINASIARAEGDPAVQAASARADNSREAHRAASLLLFQTAGLDDELARAIYERDGLLDASFPYTDVAETLCELKARGARIAIVSDIHYDLRPHFRNHGLDGFIDAWAFSYEHGWVKPEPEAFQTALRLLDLAPHEALMVGDRASRDGGAAAVGIPTLILPPAANFGPRGLNLVLRLFPAR
jgi:FMN phosphatase YigB (HAD superfamily)